MGGGGGGKLFKSDPDILVNKTKCILIIINMTMCTKQ